MEALELIDQGQPAFFLSSGNQMDICFPDNLNYRLYQCASKKLGAHLEKHPKSSPSGAYNCLAGGPYASWPDSKRGSQAAPAAPELR